MPLYRYKAVLHFSKQYLSKVWLVNKKHFFLYNNYMFTLFSINRRTHKNIYKNYELYTELKKSLNVEK